MLSQKSTPGSQARRADPPLPWKMLGRAVVALLVGFGSEFLLDMGVSALFGEDPSVARKLLFFPLSILPKAVVPLLIYWDGESWHKYLGRVSRTTWLYAAGGILFFSGGFRLIGESGFPRIVDEFRYMMGLADERGPLALLLVAGQLLYYFAEGVVMIYVIVKGSEAVEGWRPACSPWVAGVCGGLLLGLTWGLIHIISQGSIMAGVLGLILSIPLGFLYGKTRSGLPPWLAWMGLVTL